jgi:chitinase
MKSLKLLLCLLVITFAASAHVKPIKGGVVMGYVGGYKGLTNIDMINPLKLTHINYAFVDVKNNRAWLHREATDTINLRRLVALKKINPKLKIMISIGGWTWSNNFSDAVLTDTGRHAFAVSAVALVEQFHLDGVDIDWEYPGLHGAGNINRPVDKQNYTLMFRDLRHELNVLQKSTGNIYQLSTAVGAFPGFINATDMAQAQQYLDYINLMTYDFGGGKLALHHTALYASADDDKENSGDKAFRIFTAAGVPASKLTMGLAFYGRGYNVDSTTNNGYGQNIVSSFRAGGYTAIKDSLLKIPGFKSYWDKHAKAPYLFNAATRQWVTYDNPRSIKLKCRYAKNTTWPA